MVLDLDCDYIHSRGVMGSGPPGSSEWPATRVRRGLVMGAVQSGKTASLIGVIAKSLDSQADVVVLLAGTRISLWRQTYERFVRQLGLVEGSGEIPRGSRPLLRPDVSIIGSTDIGDWNRQAYGLTGDAIRRTLRQRRPIVFVAMKNVAHIQAIQELVHSRIVPVAGELGRPLHIQVFDDEADDGSILDANVELGTDPASPTLKQLPRAIVDLWSTRDRWDSTIADWVYATYTAYTATPQANFLQADFNPLAPRDFVMALRTPSDRGELEPRELTFSEPQGLRAFYTGGDIFYRRLASPSPCIIASGSIDVDVAASVKAFLVAGAIRVWSDQERLRPSELPGIRFETKAEAEARVPAPHSMLVHPSSGVADHFKIAESLLVWAFGMDPDASRDLIAIGDRKIPRALVESSIDADPESWKFWLAEYTKSAQSIASTFALPGSPKTPNEDDWPEIQRLIVDEVAPFTSVSIVNSDEGADDHPDFGARHDGSAWLPRRDLFSIFVSGNVMSRGLTLEGLTTTLFLRPGSQRVADTKMQMQRWFGYRGEYLHLCRVFLRDDQLVDFKAFHDDDSSLRLQVLSRMDSDPIERVSPLVLQGVDRVATGKIAGVATVPISPGSHPFVRMMNTGDIEDPNLAVVAGAFEGHAWQDLGAAGLVRGAIRKSPLDLESAAELLDALRYEQYVPDINSWESERWRALDSQIFGDDDDRLRPLLRVPGDGGVVSQVRSDFPYSIAAYFRLWASCLTRHVAGLVPTNNSRSRWNMVDLRRKQDLQPMFYVGVRYGSGSEMRSGPLARIGMHVKPMQRSVIDGELDATWGSRRYSSAGGAYRGDQLFDYHFHNRKLPESFRPGAWRPEGSPGLILFHVIERETGKSPSVALGISIPLGGPDQFAARASL